MTFSDGDCSGRTGRINPAPKSTLRDGHHDRLHPRDEVIELVMGDSQPLLQLSSGEHRHDRLGAEPHVIGTVVGLVDGRDEDLDVSAPKRVDDPVEAPTGARGLGEEDEVEVSGDVLHVRLGEGRQPLGTRGAGTQWRWSLEHLRVHISHPIIEQRRGDAGFVREIPIESSLADLGPLGERIHSQAGDA